MIYIVSRHPGSVEWLALDGWKGQVLNHFDPSIVEMGDCVVGTLPATLAADVCERGGRYIHLTIEVPDGHRGIELTSAQLNEFGATLTELHVRRV